MGRADDCSRLRTIFCHARKNFLRRGKCFDFCGVGLASVQNRNGLAAARDEKKFFDFNFGGNLFLRAVTDNHDGLADGNLQLPLDVHARTFIFVAVRRSLSPKKITHYALRMADCSSRGLVD